MDRLTAEQIFHDEQADARRDYFDRNPHALRFDEEWYLDHETWIRSAFAWLGNITDLSVLDLGCGHGMASVHMARQGAKVTALELSPGYLQEADERARMNGVADRIAFVHGSAEAIPLADGSVDRVWGNAILHHLDMAKVGAELARVLKPGGWAVFCEPWGGNPILEWARKRLPYPAKNRSRDEQPLRAKDLQSLAPFFSRIEVKPFQLLGMVRRVWEGGRPPGSSRSRLARTAMNLLDRCDRVLFDRWVFLHQYCRYVVLRLER